MIDENCKCQLSVAHKLIQNGNTCGDIGVFEVEYYTRHATLLCPIEFHQTATEHFK